MAESIVVQIATLKQMTVGQLRSEIRAPRESGVQAGARPNRAAVYEQIPSWGLLRRAGWNCASNTASGASMRGSVRFVVAAITMGLWSARCSSVNQGTGSTLPDAGPVDAGTGADAGSGSGGGTVDAGSGTGGTVDAGSGTGGGTVDAGLGTGGMADAGSGTGGGIAAGCEGAMPDGLGTAVTGGITPSGDDQECWASTSDDQGSCASRSGVRGRRLSLAATGTRHPQAGAAIAVTSRRRASGRECRAGARGTGCRTGRRSGPRARCRPRRIGRRGARPRARRRSCEPGGSRLGAIHGRRGSIGTMTSPPRPRTLRGGR